MANFAGLLNLSSTPTANTSAQLKFTQPTQSSQIPTQTQKQSTPTVTNPTNISSGNTSSRPATPTSSSTPSSPSSPSVPSVNYDAIYNPIISNFQNQLNDLQGSYNGFLGKLGTQYQGLQSGQNAQMASYQNTLQQNQTQTNGQINSAYGAALDQYNQMKYQLANMFPGAENSGQLGVQGLLGAAAQKAQGGLENQQIQSDQTYNGQNLDLNKWNTGQLNQMNQWYGDAQTQLYNQFSQGKNAINNDISLAESEKANAQMDLANQFVQHQMALQDYATQLQNQFQVIGSMSGNNLTPYNQQSMLNTISGLNSQIPNATKPLQSFAQLPTQQQTQTAPAFAYSNFNQNQNNSQDILSQIQAQLGSNGQSILQ